MGLAAVAGRMPFDDAATTCAAAAKTLTKKMKEMAETENGYVLGDLAMGLVAVAGRMHPDDAAKTLTDAMAKTTEPTSLRSLAKALAAVTLGLSPGDRERSAHAAVLAAGTFGSPNGLLSGLPLLHPTFHPQPRPLPPQTLVDLLKHPFCVGEAQRAVLDALEFTYKRPFADQWEFVEFVQKENPLDNGWPLDLLTSPKRPEQRP